MSTPNTARTEEVRTTVCPGGPLLVRGAASWPGPEGEEISATRPVVAVCRCTFSQRLPWCDGTHKVVPPGWDDGSENPDPQRRAAT